MEKVIEILKNAKPDMDIDFAKEDMLIDGGFLDSFDIISIVTELNDAYGIRISVGELSPENFNSAQAIYDLVTRLKAR